MNTTAAAVPAPSVTARHTGIRSKSAFETLATAGERLCDFVTVALAAAAANWVYLALHLGKESHYPAARVSQAAMLFAVILVVNLSSDGAYQRGNSLLRIRETERILRATSRSFLIVFSASFFAARLIPRSLILIGIFLVPVALILEKQILYGCLRRLHRQGYGVRRVVLYGAGSTGRRLFSALARSPKLGLAPVAIVDDDPELAGRTIYEYAYHAAASVRVIPGPLTKDLLSFFRAEVVIVAIPTLPEERLIEVAEIAASAGATLAFAPRLSQQAEVGNSCVDVDGILISSWRSPVHRTSYSLAKRLFDVTASLLLLLLSAPFWVLIALLIWLDSPGPAIFTQERVGRHGHRFRICKFRTMHISTPIYARHPGNRSDPRITRVGRWLRRTSLDELPQLINVLRGEMSLVGPRPEMPFIVETYDSRHLQRLQVVPGLTGLWQLSADRALPIHENINYDFYYIRNRNFFMDLAILFHTLVVAMKGV